MLPRDARRAWSNTEKDVLRRARREGVYSEGHISEKGEALLVSIEQARTAILAALATESPISRADLGIALGAEVSEAVAEAAILDLEGDDEIMHELMTCASCGTSQLRLRLAPVLSNLAEP